MTPSVIRASGAAMPVAIASGLMVVLLLVRQHVTLVENSVLVARLAETEQLLRHQVTHDHLTGLAGRVILWERRAQLRTVVDSPPIPVALLFVDLDDFKAVNNRHDHATGDHVLVEAAQRISRVLAPFGDHGLGVRMSGDEFAVLLTGEPARAPGEVAHDILREVMRPILVSGEPLSVGASVGVSATTSRDLQPSALLRSADEALYVIKHHGKGGVEVAPVVAVSRVDGDPVSGA